MGRSALGVTQQEIAQHVGLNTEFYSRVERGRAVPSVQTLTRLADVLGVSVDYLLGSTTEPAYPGTPRVKPPEDPPRIRRVLRQLRAADQTTLRMVLTLLVELNALRGSP